MDPRKDMYNHDTLNRRVKTEYGMTNGYTQNMNLNDGSIPPDDHNLNYYQEYCRLFIANVVLTTQMKELVAEKNELLAKLAKLEERSEELNGSKNQFESLEEKKKRFRRTALEVARHYKCPVESCQKSYGSEGSLNQHVKLKHPDSIHLLTQSKLNKTASNTAISGCGGSAAGDTNSEHSYKLNINN